MRNDLTQERLQFLLSYDPETGEFTYRLRRGCRSAGAVAGYQRKDGYVGIKIDSRDYSAHRLAWLYVNGSWPITIDHIDGDRSNNRIANLRDVSHAENHRNQGLHSNNTSGLTGVSFHKRDQRWQARITVGGKMHHLGLHATPEAAHAAYARAAEALGYSPRHIYGTQVETGR